MSFPGREDRPAKVGNRSDLRLSATEIRTSGSGQVTTMLTPDLNVRIQGFAARSCHSAVDAVDGFVAVLGAMELDSTFKARPVLLAWERDGVPLDAHFGPFQLIVPEDLRHSRNVRNVGRVEVIAP